MSLGQEGECGGPAAEDLESVSGEMLSIMSLRWPVGQDMPVLASWPDQLRALFDAFAVRLQEERQRHAEEIVEAVEGVEEGWRGTKLYELYQRAKKSTAS